ncbi:hypothetical protein [Apis mellifera filamentous virus]|uniref:hypothetical protein n=1 Tax=Apis mellifera filamentous virus TaxID=1100043 RepID=UPI0006BD779C|nr:hypothetical protein APL35_gp033 [Apis mellifera filamentous virus]AKY03102.1 hypothetical protein [Apis mellifera filamentous virus]WOK43443.1 MAG: hypothetical protein [Apis mellifera filamentous virus]
MHSDGMRTNRPSRYVKNPTPTPTKTNAKQDESTIINLSSKQMVDLPNVLRIL